MKAFGITCGVVAWLLCLVAGWVILRETGLPLFGQGEGDNDNALSQGIGLYFIGKAFFVGPLLILTALRMPSNGAGATTAE